MHLHRVPAPLCAALLAGFLLPMSATAQSAQRADSAESLYRQGRALFEQFLADSAPDNAVRDRAEALFERATALAPDSAQYWLGVAEVKRTKSLVTERMRVGDLVDRALAAAAAHGSGALAAVHYRAARLAWEDYEELAHRHLFISDVQTVSQDVILGDWRDVQQFFDARVRPDPDDPGAADRAEAEEHLRAALSAEPRHVDAAGLLVVTLLAQDRREEGLEVAQRLVRAAPDSGRAWALLGFARARAGRWTEAQTAFDTARLRMTPAQRAPYENLAVLMKPVDEVRWGAMSAEQQDALRRLYWEVSQPLFLDSLNEVQVEFFTRLTYVLHRWGDVLAGAPGWETPQGRVYLRYGPPDIRASFGRGRLSGVDAASVLENERNTIVWIYRTSQLRFIFSQTPGFMRTRFAGDIEAIYEEARGIFPVRFDNVPAVAELDTMLVQFAQFRGADTAAPTQLGVYSFMPIGRMARGIDADSLTLTTAAIVKDGLMRDVSRAGRTERIGHEDSLQIEHRSYRIALHPGDYLLRVEGQLEEADRGARSTSVLGIRRYGTDSLMLSDIVMADRVAPRDSAYLRWTDFFVLPSAGKFRPDEPVSLLWEVYNLEPDSTGTARFTVDLRFTVSEIERRGFAARILGGIGDAIGLSAQGDDRVALQYDRAVAVPPGGAVVDFVEVDLENAPEATYTVTLSITDRVSGRVIAGRRRFWVTETGLVR